MRSKVPKTCNKSAEVTVSVGVHPLSGFVGTQCMKVLFRLTVSGGREEDGD